MGFLGKNKRFFSPFAFVPGLLYLFLVGSHFNFFLVANLFLGPSIIFLGVFDTVLSMFECTKRCISLNQNLADPGQN